MLHRSATPCLALCADAAALAFGVLAGEPVMLGADGKAPEWIKITPAGRVKTRDDRSFSFDPATLVARFAADGIEIPADLDHSVPKKAAIGETGTVVGWAQELQARADGTYARVSWLEAGLATLAARTHRYVSPTFHHTEDGTATWLHSFALVPAPALSMPAVASAGLQEEASMTKKIAAALGLADTADEAACLAAISGLSAAKVDKAVHDQALANLTAVTAQKAEAEGKLAELAAAGRKAKVDALIEGALKDKKIVPAQRDHYVSLCATDEGLAQVTALLAATTPNLQASTLDGRPASETDADLLSNPVALSAAAHAFVKKQAEAGIRIAYADAVIAVKEGKK